MDNELKEIQEFLNNASNTDVSSLKKYVKLVLPHVALVAVVCLYAGAGAWIFYSLESPNEDRLKKIGVKGIGKLRKELVNTLWEKRKELKTMEMLQWARMTDVKLQHFNKYLYEAFKNQYVRYSDVFSLKTTSERNVTSKLTKRNRKLKLHSKAVKTDKLWTKRSAIFFAATTMATIGYGNIVPVTPYGRIACVFFALFGAPLTIITIGDLGKFLSECTIWLYNKFKKAQSGLKHHLIRFRPQTADCTKLNLDDEKLKAAEGSLDWDDLTLDKTEVPTILVFAILLLYIAFGGILFALLESWPYMDAFYFCFVSLTTIGFGDLVPERHEYILLTLIYLGVGLAVTTMCIDLVGIQYIQKIHYFGRKFRGTDILQLLKKKRMIERKLVMGDCDGILQMYLKQLQETCNMVSEDNSAVATSDKQLSTASIETQSLWYQQKLPKHSFNGPKSSGDSEVLSISPSVSLREAAYQNYYEYSPSIESFKYTFPCDVPVDIKAVADEMMKLDSVPMELPEVIIYRPSRAIAQTQTSTSGFSEPNLPTSVTASLAAPRTSPVEIASIAGWNSYNEMSDKSRQPSAKKFRPRKMAKKFSIQAEMTPMLCGSEERLIEKLFEKEEDLVSVKARKCKSVSLPLSCKSSESSSSSSSSLISERRRTFKLNLSNSSTANHCFSQNVQQPIIYHQAIPVHSVHQTTVQTKNAVQNLVTAPESMLCSKLPPDVVDDNFCFVIDAEKITLEDVSCDDFHWKHTSRSKQYFYSEDLHIFHRVNCITARGKIVAAKFARTRPQTSDIFLNIFHVSDLSSAQSTPTQQPGNIFITPPVPSAFSVSGFHANGAVPLADVYVVSRFYSFWRTCPTFHRIVTMLSRVDENKAANPKFKKRLFVQYIWRNTKPTDKARVKSEFNRNRVELSQLKMVKKSKTERRAFTLNFH